MSPLGRPAPVEQQDLHRIVWVWKAEKCTCRRRDEVSSTSILSLIDKFKQLKAIVMTSKQGLFQTQGHNRKGVIGRLMAFSLT